MLKVDCNLYRGPRPTSFANLQKLGFQRVINLQSGFEDATSESRYENEMPALFGIEVIRFRWSNFLPPTDIQLSEFITVAGRPPLIKTYVHCHSGVDRTGAAMLAYRVIHQGWRFSDAYDEFVERGRHVWFFYWKPFLWAAIVNLLKEGR